jgi:hypothetical protein
MFVLLFISIYNKKKHAHHFQLPQKSAFSNDDFLNDNNHHLRLPRKLRNPAGWGGLPTQTH